MSEFTKIAAGHYTTRVNGYAVELASTGKSWSFTATEANGKIKVGGGHKTRKDALAAATTAIAEREAGITARLEAERTVIDAGVTSVPGRHGEALVIGSPVTSPHGITGTVARFDTRGQVPGKAVDVTRVTVWVTSEDGKRYAFGGRDLALDAPVNDAGPADAVTVSACRLTPAEQEATEWPEEGMHAAMKRASTLLACSEATAYGLLDAAKAARDSGDRGDGVMAGKRERTIVIQYIRCGAGLWRVGAVPAR